MFTSNNTCAPIDMCQRGIEMVVMAADAVENI